MSAELREQLSNLARETAVRACWRQWVGLGAPAAPTGRGEVRSVIEVESLLVTSLLLVREERRLFDMVSWWARTASSLTSVGRYRPLKRRFPPGAVEETLEDFAALAAEFGDRRWKSHAGDRPPGGTPRGSKGPNEPALTADCTLLVRLRAGLGVGAKADTLSFLLGLGGGGATVSGITFATGYTKVSVGRAAEEMARAGLIVQTNDRPLEYRALPEPWGNLLGLGRGSSEEGGARALPRWRYWSEIFAFLVGVMEWATHPPTEAADDSYVSASKARDLLEKHRKVFVLNNIGAPPPSSFPGREAPQGLAETTQTLADWIDRAI